MNILMSQDCTQLRRTTPAFAVLWCHQYWHWAFTVLLRTRIFRSILVTSRCELCAENAYGDCVH